MEEVSQFSFPTDTRSGEGARSALADFAGTREVVGPKNSCGDRFVFMVQAAEHRPSADVEAFRLRRGDDSDGRRKIERAMRTRSIAVGGVLREDGPQVPLVDDNEVIQALAARGS